MVTNRPSNAELDFILHRDFTTVFRSGYVQVKGVTLPRRFLDIQNDISNWTVRDRDIWIVTFPKTGTTWTQEMVWMIMNDLDFKKGEENLGSRSPFLEVSALFDFRKFKKEHSDFKPPPFLDDSLKFVQDESKKGDLCLKTHLPWSLLPKSIQDNSKKPKAMSYAPYWNHVLPFWERRNQPNLLFLKYEKMVQDLPSVIKEVADFLEKPLSPENISLLAEHLSFDSMKKNPAVNYEMVVNLNRKYKFTDTDGCFMRSGKEL
ncbi:unnamed protein product [Phyllotreta striolata]|uniref:Sulfotransferase domain-containing protein n=1 Tax=Phyllotreta striolata TaxID=444603 RepID=A0A9N9TS64_PHYSR|nr:unnamed protein product [Phyllotreta striolata]